MKAVIYNKNEGDKKEVFDTEQLLTERGSYVAPIILGKNQSALYLNELMYNATSSFKKEGKLLAHIKAPSLYNVARKINKNDSFLTITTTTDITYEDV